LTQETLNDQRMETSAAPSAESGWGWGRWVAIAVGCMIAIAVGFIAYHQVQVSDPYIQSVLALEGDADRGQDIFRLNCATCHGLEASGEVGPSLQGVSERKSRVQLIQQVVSGGTPPMPQFQPNARDMADLLKFLETL
jgi:mono/diheme cytochrome c family protein